MIGERCRGIVVCVNERRGAVHETLDFVRVRDRHHAKNAEDRRAAENRGVPPRLSVLLGVSA
jgi:hypothetical protein